MTTLVFLTVILLAEIAYLSATFDMSYESVMQKYNSEE